MGGIKRSTVIAALVAAVVVLGAGVAVAGVSDGNYSPARQHCTGHADDYIHEDEIEPDCLNLVGSVGDGAGHEAGWVGTHQTPEGVSVNDLDYGTPPGFDPASGLRVYFGADDNLDVGEHDSSAFIGDGPSDGGGVQLNVLPATADAWSAALAAGDLAYLAHHPFPVVDAGAGACADGICFSGQTTQRTAFVGTGPGQRPVANYDGKQWDPETCAGPSDGEAECGPGGILTWVGREGVTTVEPGIQIYEDPSPEGSPIGPYPLPAVYVGTCGVILGGGPLQIPASPLTNTAGQLVIPTAC